MKTDLYSIVFNHQDTTLLKCYRELNVILEVSIIKTLEIDYF